MMAQRSNQDPTMVESGRMMTEDSSSDDASEVLEDEGAHSSSNGDHSHHASQSSDSSLVQIARAESQAVNISKVAVYFVLFVLALVTAGATWFYVRKEESDNFEHEYHIFADELIEAAEDKAVTVFRQLHTLSTAITSHALDSDEPWPYVTLPHYYKRTQELGELSGSNLIIFAPLVDLDREEEWRDWVQTHEEHVFLDTFGPEDASRMEPTRAVQKVEEEIVVSTNLPLLEEEFLLPVLQYGPHAASSALINYDMNSHPVIQRALRDATLTQHTILSEVTDLTFLLGFTDAEVDTETPRSVIVEPVFDHFDDDTRSVVGIVLAIEAWESYFSSTNLPEEVHGFVVDVHSESCSQDLTFVIDGEHVGFRGHADFHDPAYDSLAHVADFATFARYDGAVDGARHCEYQLRVYPSSEFEEDFYTSKPYLYALALVSVFVATVAVFAFYDWRVGVRQNKVAGAAERTTAIVHSLFPKAVGDRLIAEAQNKADKERAGRTKGKLEAFTSDSVAEDCLDKETGGFHSDPIANFYTDTTIMFADVVGFTAWSSTREPKQVFSLLETIYHDFDVTAQRRRVFKVETVGDCYVAVAGLPTPRKDHAVVMCRFARDIMYQFQALSHQLEVTLGPDTADLALRIGLHSGPVTGGVLRGDRARFQLFGDTMNTSSRMESTSQAHKVQISQETADLLIQAEKGHWCRKREDLVDAKGKGRLQTYWLEVKSATKSSTSGSDGKQKDTTTSDSDDYTEQPSTLQGVDHATKFTRPAAPLVVDKNALRAKESRLVRWNVEILTRILMQVLERRKAAGTKADPEEKIRRLEQRVLYRDDDTMVLDEVLDIIRLPSCREYAPSKTTVGKAELPTAVKDQLQDYVQTVAEMYRSSNPFHNFEHASHVTMSVAKLLSRIVAPDKDLVGDSEEALHDHTYGITSDPLTQFACAMSAMIHDVDHEGVPNATLVKEQTPAAATYQNKSVAEQNSVDLAWSLLMQDDYAELRRSIYTTQSEFARFRSLIVNSVMATDIMDKNLGAQRKNRWAKAFSEGALGEDRSDLVNRRATIVLEHLIQASDVAHTMQHWEVFKKWNQRLFQELYKAFKDGRGDTDPSEFWYEGEIGFFEFYIIPLAKKLKDCGVFGVSSDEYLNYALRNKREWVARGQQMVEEYKEAALIAFPASETTTNNDMEEKHHKSSSGGSNTSLGRLAAVVEESESSMKVAPTRKKEIV